MELQVPISMLKQLKARGCTNQAILDISWSKWAEQDDHAERVESRFLQLSDVALLKQLVKLPQNETKVENRRLYSQCIALERILSGSLTDQTQKVLKALPEAIVRFCKDLPHHWVFHLDSTYKAYLPYFVTDCEYHRAHDGHPAYVSFKAKAIERGDHQDIGFTVFRDNLGKEGRTVPEIFAAHDIFPETPELVQAYEKDMATYNIIRDKLGDQFLASGTGVTARDTDSDDQEHHHWWSGNHCTFVRDGFPTKVIMDDTEGWDKDSQMVGSSLFQFQYIKTDDEDMDARDKNDSQAVKLPIHPICRVFDLRAHTYALVHTSNLEVYQYNPKLGEKLVLPKNSRRLIDILLNTAADVQQDIIKGKAGGTLVLASGEPGTGKTLTAEVYSEVAQRPLYIVQCSQLGLDSTEVETELGKVLKRATRWKAILLIDEADVYIHERGTDMKQNAVVGVFLRLLEYFSGVMFLTTNRATVVDDAIVSRIMAHIRYLIPTEMVDRLSLWTILGEQYKCGLSKETVSALATNFTKISGRTIKQLLRLAKAVAQQENRPVDLELVTWVSQFQDTETKKE